MPFRDPELCPEPNPKLRPCTEDETIGCYDCLVPEDCKPDLAADENKKKEENDGK